MTRWLVNRIGVALSVAALALSPSAVFAGEVTGNGKLLHVDGGGKWGTGVNGRSFCAYSGQEDLQFFTDDGDGTALTDPTKGVPGHAQSWGQTPDHQSLPAEFHPGISCNPNLSTFGEP
jgi:hypothetical protein